MAYTFGAGTGDDITWAGAAFGGSATALLTAGWWYPTTLTATRGLWSAGNTFGAEIDTTTTELRLRTDNTTDKQWTTTGAALATSKWSFLAFLSTQLNTGAACAWRVWMGTIDTAPVEITVTVAVAGTGNFTSNSNMYLGNKGTGTLAFQGDIGSFCYLNSSSAASAVANPFSIATHGAISAGEADFVYLRFVLSLWLGNGFAVNGSLRHGGAIASSGEEMGYIDLSLLPQVRRHDRASASRFSGVTPTINGATYSQNGPPRPLMPHSPYLPHLVA